MSQRTTKPTIKLVRQSDDSDQRVHPRSLIRVFADRKGILQPPGYPKMDKREHLPYYVDLLIRVFAGHTGLIIGFVVTQIIFMLCHSHVE